MLPGEYRRKARKLDRDLCGTPDGVQGPVERQLQQYGRLRGLVFGAWAEASPDVELLLGLASHLGAERHWMTMGVSDPAAAQGVLAWMLRWRWGMAALRENARLKLERLEFVGRGAVDAVMRRTAAAMSAQLCGPVPWRSWIPCAGHEFEAWAGGRPRHRPRTIA